MLQEGGIHTWHNYTTNNIIENNEIYNSREWGIILAGEHHVYGNTIKYNKIWDESSLNDNNGIKYWRTSCNPNDATYYDPANCQTIHSNSIFDNYSFVKSSNISYPIVFNLSDNEYFIVNGKTIKKIRNGSQVGTQTFSSNVYDIEYTGSVTFVGLSNGKILKVTGKGGDGNNMFNVSETSSGFSHISGYTKYYIGSHKFWGSVKDISYIKGYTFVSFGNKKILKIRGTGGGGNNLFAITETSSGFSGISGYNYYVGNQKFNYHYPINIRYIDGYSYVTFSNRKVLKIKNVGGGGNNMFAINETLTRIYNISGYNYYVAYNYLGKRGWLVVKDAKYIPSWKAGNKSIIIYPKNTLKSSLDKDTQNKLTQNEIDSEFKIYPNPSSGIVKITFNSNDNAAKFNITNLQGAKVFETKITNKSMEIDLTSYPKGLYFINIIKPKNIITKKVIIE